MRAEVRPSGKQEKNMISPEAERIHKQAVIVEGHRDVFEMVRLNKMGQRYPVVNTIVPRLRKGGIAVSVFAICGDSVSHWWI
jgi:recombinational DNA repair protein RecR